MTMPANTTSSGFCFAISVNFTIVLVPVPFPNMGHRSSAAPNVTNIFIVNALACNLATLIMMSVGDQTGVVGGVASGTVGSTCQNIKGSSKVSVGCMPATCLSHPTRQNSTNTVGCDASPCQAKVFFCP